MVNQLIAAARRQYWRFLTWAIRLPRWIMTIAPRTLIVWPAIVRRRSGLSTAYVRGLPAPIWLRNGTSDVAVFREVWIELEHDFGRLGQPRYIIDAGANIGLSSLLFLRRYPGCRIVAVEPDADNVAIARKNLEQYPSATLLESAVWSNERPLVVKRGAFRDGDYW